MINKEVIYDIGTSNGDAKPSWNICILHINFGRTPPPPISPVFKVFLVHLTVVLIFRRVDGGYIFHIHLIQKYMTSKVTPFKKELNRNQSIIISWLAKGFWSASFLTNSVADQKPLASEEGQNWHFFNLFFNGKYRATLWTRKTYFCHLLSNSFFSLSYDACVFSNFKDNSFLIMEIRPTNE